MKNYSIIIILAFFIFFRPLSAQNRKQYNVTFSKEILIFSGGLSLNLISNYLINNMNPPDTTLLERNHVPVFDRFAIDCHDQFTAHLSDVSLIMSMGLPVISILQTDSKAEKQKRVLLYMESVLITSGITNIVKALVHRPRPYAYRKDQEILDTNAARSFFSGHTSLAFNGAVVAGMFFENHQDQSAWHTYVWTAGLTLASATGIFRITSGNHFLSDVIAGALAGFLTGYLVLKLH